MADPGPVPSRSDSRRQARVIMDTIADFNRGLPELRKTNPELAERITREQQEVADCRRRAAMNRDLLDMRLD